MFGKPARRVIASGAALLGACSLANPANAAAADAADRVPITLAVTAKPSPPDWFGTVALPCDPGRYAARWEHASGGGASAPMLARLVAPAHRLSPDGQIAFVQAAVHRQVRWLSDATQWNAQDYWARAGETLEQGSGDDEDRAIVKLQALRALGFPARDLYLTLGRDEIGGPTVLLMVRSGGRMWALDDLGGSPIPAERRPDFKPTITFAMGGAAWLHGRRVSSTGNVAAR